MYRTRLAPSPTGALHLGNARSFLVTWLRARQKNGRVVLRVENLEHPKVKNWMIAQIYADLRYLGIDWDEGDDREPAGEFAPYTQSERLPLYRAALNKLRERGLLYPCLCSRADIENVQLAPHAGEELFYPNWCRERKITVAELRDYPNVAWRFRAPTGEREYHDNFRGVQRADVQKFSGDFVVARGREMEIPAYQLACVVDDAAMKITEVIRGDDLTLSAFRQLALYEALSLPAPEFLHLPLLVGDDGRRLAKRHGDTRIASFRENGVAAEKIIGHLAWISGLRETPAPVTTPELIVDFALEKIPRTSATVKNLPL